MGELKEHAEAGLFSTGWRHLTKAEDLIFSAELAVEKLERARADKRLVVVRALLASAYQGVFDYVESHSDG